MKRRGRPVVYAFVCWLACVGPAPAFEVETAQGRVSIASAPQRVAAFDIAAIDTLQRLGVTLAGVPKKLFIAELETATAGVEKVGTLFEPDLEALNALSPDLIIVGGRSSPRAASTARVARTIDMTMTGDDLIADARARLAAYGALFEKSAEAQAVAAEFDAAIAAARAAIAGKGNGLILMTNGPKISAYGPGSRFGWLHTALGLPPAVDVAAAVHGEAVSFEFVAKANPDWLIVVDRAAAIGSGEQNARATLDNELVAGVTAWRKGQVVYLPAADFYLAAGGVQATTRVLAALTDAFSQAR
ncbi:siderophore ABC transporter substrate-binding protein [Methylopila sp. M107]|uniref:siderophore ABC transporter substrate-binding protein n=1 Tax=Methylopila sp. M107 TaxID=1101190 RepID=UPI0003A17837|nr:siderophore ABC transporter substrate-binding protein [Methylopila sp. M107]